MNEEATRKKSFTRSDGIHEAIICRCKHGVFAVNAAAVESNPSCSICQSTLAAPSSQLATSKLVSELLERRSVEEIVATMDDPEVTGEADEPNDTAEEPEVERYEEFEDVEA